MAIFKSVFLLANSDFVEAIAATTIRSNMTARVSAAWATALVGGLLIVEVPVMLVMIISVFSCKVRMVKDIFSAELGL